jgi:hypothetical protein
VGLAENAERRANALKSSRRAERCSPRGVLIRRLAFATPQCGEAREAGAEQRKRGWLGDRDGRAGDVGIDVHVGKRGSSVRNDVLGPS